MSTAQRAGGRGLCTGERMNYVPVSSESKSVLPRTLPGTLTVVDARVCSRWDRSLTDLQVWCPRTGRLLPPFQSRSLQDSVVAEWNFSFMTLKFFFKSSLFLPVGYPYIPSFQAPELAVKFWSEPEVQGFLFCDPNEMLLLRKDLFFLF